MYLESVLSITINYFKNVLGEETIKSAGLGAMTPVGFLQHALEFMHVTCGLPWWGAIIAGKQIFFYILYLS